MPVAGATLPRAGAQRAWGFRRSPTHVHAGVDLPARAGELVLAPEAGTVELVARASYGRRRPRFSDPLGWRGYGPVAVVLRGESGRWHLLAHLAHAGVRAGDELAEGAGVGDVSPVGRHLHWEVREQLQPRAGAEPFTVTVDPARWLAERGELDAGELVRAERHAAQHWWLLALALAVVAGARS